MTMYLIQYRIALLSSLSHTLSLSSLFQPCTISKTVTYVLITPIIKPPIAKHQANIFSNIDKINRLLECKRNANAAGKIKQTNCTCTCKIK